MVVVAAVVVVVKVAVGRQKRDKPNSQLNNMHVSTRVEDQVPVPAAILTTQDTLKHGNSGNPGHNPQGTSEHKRARKGSEGESQNHLLSRKARSTLKSSLLPVRSINSIKRGRCRTGELEKCLSSPPPTPFLYFSPTSPSTRNTCTYPTDAKRDADCQWRCDLASLEVE